MSEETLEAARHIGERLQPYCTILLKLFIDANGAKRVTQVGSGTFACVGMTHGILTAFHCTEPLTGDYLLGLTAAPEHGAHNFTLAREDINIVPIAVPTSDEYGPDLAFITIANWGKIETIKASKAFVSLSADKERISSHDPFTSQSIWYICGVPNERLEPTQPEAGFLTTFQFEHLCTACGINRSYVRAGHDYAEIDVIPSPGDTPPQSFEGMSGGGLWEVPVGPAADTHFSPTGYYLSGVVFYQGISPEGVRFIRCHFRDSIYRSVLDGVS